MYIHSDCELAYTIQVDSSFKNIREKSDEQVFQIWMRANNSLMADNLIEKLTFLNSIC